MRNASGAVLVRVKMSGNEGCWLVVTPAADGLQIPLTLNVPVLSWDLGKELFLPVLKMSESGWQTT